MSLKLRTLFAVGSLVAVLLVSAVGAAFGFHELATAVRDVVAENYRSVVAAHDMSTALDDENAAVLALLLEPTLEGRQALSVAEARFGEALGRATRNVTIEGEAEAVERITAQYRRWSEARDQLLGGPGEAPLAQYHQHLVDDFTALRHQVAVLVELNHVAMVEGDQRAFELARRRAGLSAVLVAVAILGAAWLWRIVRIDLLDRLAELAEVGNAVATGHPRRASIARADELGAVASALNRALDAEEAMRLGSRADLASRRRLLIALLHELTPDAVLLGPSGELFAACTGKGEDVSAAARPELRRLGLDEDQPSLEIQVQGRPWRLQRLASGDDAPCVGWLARPAGR